MHNSVIRSAKGGQLRYIVVLAPMLLLSFLMTGVATDCTYRNSLAQLERESHFKLNLYKKVVLSELKRHAYLPLMLSKDDQVLSFLFNSEFRAEGQALNSHLETLSEGTDALNIYLMNLAGTTIATSNWNDETSYLGQNYHYRPYFQDALQGKPSIFFAIGATTGISGLFLSSPVYINDSIAGVVVVKVSMRPLEKLWAEQGAEKVFLTDDNGIIFSSNEAGWRFNAVSSLTSLQQKRLKADRKYLDFNIKSLPITQYSNYLEYRLVHIRENVRSARYYLWQDQALPNSPWKLHIMASSQPARESAINAFFLGILLSAFVGLLGYVMLKRRRVADRLQEAHDLLEQRVEARTQELSKSNQRLTYEVIERQKAHEALRRAQDDLIQNSKLAALGQMSAGITHELNQPLSAIQTFARNGEKLLDRERYSAAQESFSRIYGLTTRMGEIINHLKTFARKSEKRREPVDLVECIQSALQLVEHMSQRDQVHIELLGSQQAVFVLGDPVRLEQVFVNLLSNGVQALVSSEQANKVIQIKLSQSKSLVVISIHDNGPGFDDQILESIFDPFFTTKELGEGMGLGLSIVYGILMEHNGKIHARNDSGAEICVQLPALDSSRQ
ncbi:sensor histidine kinase [Oceanospirillum maris]|uniref:sensor histidine kinase n=1 Tax=Oceanospirillum maris TaxID=64977 RepID=UPI0012FEE781|nr:ATP-binding protein [Oceanospirillum maris]